MKPSPQYDFPVEVRDYIWEVSLAIAPLYQGIYSVILNFQISIAFVPEFERSQNNWPPMLPEDIDDIHTVQEARLIMAAMSKYTITPNLLLAGQTEIIPPFDPELDPGTVFYVSPQDFDVFSTELSTIEDLIPGPTFARKISDVKNLEFAKFIQTQVITSKYFAIEDLRLLGRVTDREPLKDFTLNTTDPTAVTS